MKQKTIGAITYRPRTYKGNGKFYPCISSTADNGVNETYMLSKPMETRSKARTIAINHIKNIDK